MSPGNSFLILRSQRNHLHYQLLGIFRIPFSFCGGNQGKRIYLNLSVLFWQFTNGRKQSPLFSPEWCTDLCSRLLKRCQRPTPGWWAPLWSWPPTPPERRRAPSCAWRSSLPPSGIRTGRRTSSWNSLHHSTIWSQKLWKLGGFFLFCIPPRTLSPLVSLSLSLSLSLSVFGFAHSWACAKHRVKTVQLHKWCSRMLLKESALICNRIIPSSHVLREHVPNLRYLPWAPLHTHL